MKFSNLRIGRQIATVLGVIIAVLISLSVFSLWGNHTGDRMRVLMDQRLTKARLAEDVDSQTSGIVADVAQMIILKKAPPELVNDVAERKKLRLAVVEQFRALADSPTSIKHGADMAEMLQSASSASEATIEAIAAGRTADAMKEFRTYISRYSVLRAKAGEASRFQQDRVVQMTQEDERTSRLIWIGLIAGCIVAIVVASLGGFVLTRSIAKPLGLAVSDLENIAAGDLSRDVPAEFLAHRDEIGDLARAMQKTIDSLRQMIQEISSGVQVLSSSSTELMASSTQMASGAQTASDRANSVSAAAEQMSSNITSVAAGMEQTTTNLSHVAAATGEMTATIGEIAQNSEKARRITDEANRQAARITEQIHELGTAAREIGKVTETITEISSQTNLLALNATIEAARAGAAGKGFAVVATEIKALAQQTAGATEDIKGRIAGVQSATSGGIAEVEKVSKVIQEVSAIVASIAAAIEEQSTATKDIARNIAEASTGVNEANTRVAETSQVSREIAKDIVSVNGAARDMAGNGEQVRSSAGELSTVAETLRSRVAQFQV